MKEENKLMELERRLEIARQAKLELNRKVSELECLYKTGKIDYETYFFKLSKALKGRSEKEWEKYYDNYIKACEARLRQPKKFIEEIKKQELGKTKTNLFVWNSMIIAFLLILAMSGLYFTSTYIGYTTLEGMNITEENATEINATIENITAILNATANITENATIENITENTTSITDKEYNISANAVLDAVKLYRPYTSQTIGTTETFEMTCQANISSGNAITVDIYFRISDEGDSTCEATDTNIPETGTSGKIVYGNDTFVTTSSCSACQPNVTALITGYEAGGPFNLCCHAKKGGTNKLSTESITVEVTASSDSNPPDTLNVTAEINQTWVGTGEFIRMNLTIKDDSKVDQAIFNITLAGTGYNYTAINTTAGGANESEWFNITGFTTEGLYNWTAIFANDSSNNINITRLDLGWWYDASNASINISTPLNNTMNITNSTPMFWLNFTDKWSPTGNCTFYMQNGSDQNTLRWYWENQSVKNNTLDVLKPNVTLSEGYYWYWANCTDLALNLNKSQPMNISIELARPTILNIVDVDDDGTDLTAQSITESLTTWFNFTFYVKHEAGRQFIDNATAKANFTNYTTIASNDYDKDGTSDICQPEDPINDTAQNFSCLTPILWYYTNMSWMANVSINDTNVGNLTKRIINFSINPTTAIITNASALTWPGLSLISTNSTAYEGIGLNNTGNTFIAGGASTATPDGVRVTSKHLAGDLDQLYRLNATGFSIAVNQTDVCDKNNKTWVTDDSAVPIFGAGMGTGKSEVQKLFFCLRDIPSNATAQQYSTAILGLWTIAVAGT